MLDLETFFIAVYTVVDDIYKEAAFPLIGNRNGPEPHFSDSEVITLSLVAEFLGIDSERAFLSFIRKNFSYLFPIFQKDRATTEGERISPGQPIE